MLPPTHMCPHVASLEESASGHDNAANCVSTMDSGTDLLQGQEEALPIMEKNGTYPCSHDHILNGAATMGVLAATTPLGVGQVVLVPPHYEAVRMLTWQPVRLHVSVILLSRAVALLKEHRHRRAVSPKVPPSLREALHKPVHCHR